MSIRLYVALYGEREREREREREGVRVSFFVNFTSFVVSLVFVKADFKDAITLYGAYVIATLTVVQVSITGSSGSVGNSIIT